MMWALGLLGAVRKGLAALWALAVKYPALAALVASLCLSAWLWRGWNHAETRADKWQTAWTAMDDANKKATAWAKAEKRAKETAATDIKESANDRRKTVQAAGARAGDDYRARNQCVRVTPAQGGGVNADLPRPDSSAGQPEGQGGNAELVAVDPASFNACTVNSLDLANAQAWAADMVAKGLAK